MAALNEHPQVLLQRVAAGSGQCDRIAYGDAAMVAGVIDDPQGKIRYDASKSFSRSTMLAIQKLRNPSCPSNNPEPWTIV